MVHYLLGGEWGEGEGGWVGEGEGGGGQKGEKERRLSVALLHALVTGQAKRGWQLHCPLPYTECNTSMLWHIFRTQLVKVYILCQQCTPDVTTDLWGLLQITRGFISYMYLLLFSSVQFSGHESELECRRK